VIESAVVTIALAWVGLAAAFGRRRRRRAALARLGNLGRIALPPARPCTLSNPNRSSSTCDCDEHRGMIFRWS